MQEVRRINTELGAIWILIEGNKVHRVSFKPIPIRLAKSPFGYLVEKAIVSYLNGEKVDLSWIPVSYGRLSPFNIQVLDTLRREVDFGNIISYSDLAKLVGNPCASRAVGQALRRNPLPVIIPCHRVISKKGELGGFSGGVHWKRFLLKLEGY